MGTTGALQPGFDLRACYWLTSAFNVSREGLLVLRRRAKLWGDLVAHGNPAALSGSGRFAGPAW